MPRPTKPIVSQFVTRLLSLAFVLFRQIMATVLKRGNQARIRRMVLLESLELGNRRQLFLIRCDNHCFLVGAGADRIGTLVAMPTAASEAVPMQTGARHSRLSRRPVVHGRADLQIVKRQHASANHADANRIGNRIGEQGVETGGSWW